MSVCIYDLWITSRTFGVLLSWWLSNSTSDVSCPEDVSQNHKAPISQHPSSRHVDMTDFPKSRWPYEHNLRDEAI